MNTKQIQFNMKFAIIISKKDQAGLNIKERLLELYEFKDSGEVFEGDKVYELNENVKLYSSDKDSIHCENIDKQIDAGLFIFATKHESKSKIPSLSVHVQGNWSKAEYGGKDRELCVAPASYLKKGLRTLNKLAVDLDFEIIQECTHHGPYLEKPTMFIEIGSDETQWNNEKAAKIIAKTIHILVSEEIGQFRAAVGIGGLHHTPNFKKIVLNSDIALGHVCPKYMLEYIDKEMIEQAIARTEPKAEVVILDWKGLKEFKRKITAMLDELNIPVKRTKDF